MPHGRALCFFAFLFLFAALGVCQAAESPRPQEWAEAVSLPDSENFFRVSKDLYRSAQPSKKGMRAYEQ